MNEVWKKRAKLVLRGTEIMLGVALLAVLLELVLVMLNSPGPIPEIRFVRSSAPPVAEPAVVPAPLPPAPAPVIAEKPAAQPPPAAPRPQAPVLLDFENLRRLLGVAKAPPANNGTGGGIYGGNGSAGDGGGQTGSPSIAMVTVVPVIVPPDKAPPTNNPATPSTNDAPSNVTQADTNRVNNTNSNTDTNSPAPAFRLSVP